MRKETEKNGKNCRLIGWLSRVIDVTGNEKQRPYYEKWTLEMYSKWFNLNKKLPDHPVWNNETYRWKW